MRSLNVFNFWILGLLLLAGAARADDPVIEILAPATGGTVKLGQGVTLEILAEDGDGNERIVKVEVFNNGELLGVAGLVDADAGDWKFDFVPETPGLYVLEAVATDDTGATGTSAPVLLTLLTAPGPEVFIISVEDGEIFPVGGTVTLTAIVVGNNRPVSVKFYANGFPIGEATTFPYTITYPLTNADPALNLTAVAIEEGFGTGIDNVTVQVFDNLPPEVEIVPVVEAFTLGSTIPVVAEAGDLDGQVTQVEFFANRLLIGTAAATAGGGFVVNWRPSIPGLYELQAVATDNTGNRAESFLEIEVLPRIGQPPIGSIYITPQEESYAIGSEVFLSADAADVDGNVEFVTFLVNGELVGFSTEEPYNVRISFREEDVSFKVDASTPPQLYSNVTLLVEDNDGNLAVVNAPVLIAPLTRRLPKVDITSPEPGSIFGLGSSLQLQAAMRTIDVAVDGIQFYEDQSLIGIAQAEPYTVARTPEEAGDFTYEAVAHYSYDVTYVFPGDSPLEVVVPTLVSDISDDPVTVTFSSSGPFVQLLNPREGDLLTLNQPVPLTARAIPSAGGALSVQFYEVVAGDLIPIGEADTEEPYTADYKPVTTGSRSIFARVEETGVGVTDSNRARVTVVLDSTPTVNLVSPEDGSEVSLGIPVAITAEVTSTGSAVGVEFFANGFQIGTVSTFPYVINWLPPSAGTFFLTARVTQQGFGSATSPARIVTVTGAPPPGVTLTSSSSQVTARSSVQLTAAVAETGIALAQVEFFANGISVGKATTAPYTVTWTPFESGLYEVRAVALDVFGNQATSNTIIVEVTPLVGRGPAVFVDHPLPLGNGDTVNDYSVASNLFVNATAIDADGLVANVQFFANGERIAGTVGRSGDRFGIRWDPPFSGTFSLTASATDSQGNTASSQPIRVEIGELQAPLPKVTLEAVPVLNGTSYLGEPVTLTATVDAGLLVVNRVDFYAGGVLLGSAVNAENTPGKLTLTFDWEPEVAGTYTLNARAVQVDPNGQPNDNSVISNGRSLTVAAPSENRTFTVQSYEDLLEQTLTTAELDAIEARLAAGSLTETGLILEVLDNPQFRVYREAIMTWFVMTGGFPTRLQLLSAAEVIQTQRTPTEPEEPTTEEPLPPPAGTPEQIEDPGVSGVETLVTQLQNEFVKVFGDPLLLSGTAYNSLIFKNKYGLQPAGVQQLRMDYLLAERGQDRPRLTAEIILDNTLITAGSLTYTKDLQIAYPPNNRLPGLAETAALFIDLLRVRPSVDEVVALAAKPRAEQVAAILADPRYAARFEEDLAGADSLGAGWQFLEWFGFFNTMAEPWIYHQELKWIYEETTQPVPGMWLYYAPLGWVWTAAEVYPYFWSGQSRSWVYYQKGTLRPNWFYDYQTQTWKSYQQ